jgi:hypothetical protein
MSSAAHEMADRDADSSGRRCELTFGDANIGSTT